MDFKIIIFLACSCLLTTSIAANKQFCLVDNGQAKSVIVVAEKPKGCVPVAVKQLIGGINKISGCELSVVKVSAENFKSVRKKLVGKVPILLGQSAWTNSLHISPPGKCDAFIVKTFSGVVIIMGNDDRDFNINFNKVPASAGTLYGVTKFLEVLGTKFYFTFPQGKIIPKHKTITIDPLNIFQEPYFKYRLCEGANTWRRQIGYGGNCDPWATRHSFVQLNNWEKLFTKSHPEYFCLNKSNCLSNNLYMIAFPHDGVIDEIIKQVKEYFSSKRISGKRNYFLVIQNDYFKEMCSCDKCQKMIDYSRKPNGYFSDYMADAVIKVANAVKNDFPEAKIVYCAYEHYQLPPKKIKKIPDNVIVLIAQNRNAAGTPLGREEMNSLVKSWQKLKPNSIAFCRYYMNGKNIIPRFNPRGIAANIKDMKRLSETGPTPLIGEMHFTRAGYWWFELLEYITARCLWNPDLDIEQLLNDFCKNSFGPAAKPMLEYLNLLEKYHLENPRRGTFSNKQLKKLARTIHRAQSLAVDSPWKQRIEYYAKHFAKIKSTIKKMSLLKRKCSSTAILPDKNIKPIISFDFDLSLSSIVKDTSGNNRHGILVGAKRVKSGIKQKALEFDGEKDYILLRKAILLDKSYTLEAWIKPQKMNKKVQILGELTAMYRPYHIFGSAASCHAYDRISVSIRGGKVFFRDKDIASITASEELPQNKWSYIVATYSPKNGMLLYVNGQLVAFSGAKKRKTGSKNPLLQLIGASGGISSRHGENIADCRGFFRGEIDQVKVYKKELAHDQIKRQFEKYLFRK